MTALEKINFVISSYGRAFIALFNVRLWPPFLIYLMILVSVVWAIQSMFAPLLAGWLIPLVKTATAESVLHYPQHLIMLPHAFERFRFLAVSPIVEAALMAAAYIMFAAYFTKQRPRFIDALRQALRRYHLVLIAVVVNTALVYSLFLTLPDLFRDFTVGSPRRQLALSVGLQGLSLLLTALFAYVVPFLVIAKRSLAASFVGSFVLFFRNFFMTYFLVLIPNLVLIGLGLILQQYTEEIVTKFHPRVMVGLTYLNALLSIGVNFVIVATITRFFLESTEE
jgi:hypothetical protein